MFLAADASAQCAEYVMNHLRAGSAVAGKAFQPIAGRLFSWRRGQHACARERAGQCADNLRLWLRTWLCRQRSMKMGCFWWLVPPGCAQAAHFWISMQVQFPAGRTRKTVVVQRNRVAKLEERLCKGDGGFSRHVSSTIVGKILSFQSVV